MRYSKKSTFDNPNIRDLALNVGMGRKDTGHAHIDVEIICAKGTKRLDGMPLDTGAR